MKGEQERGSYRRGGLQRSQKPVMREIRIMKSEGGEGKGRGTGYSSMVGLMQELKYRCWATKANDILVPAYWKAKNQYCKHSVRMI